MDAASRGGTFDRDLAELRAATDPDEIDRWLNLLAYSSVGREHALVEECRRLLRHADDDVRGSAAYALAYAAATADAKAPLLPELVDLCSSPSDYARDGAATALLYIGPAAAPATSHLIRLCDDPNRSVRELAYAALGAIGPTAKAALPVLVRRLAAEDVDMCRWELAEAIEAIGLEDDRFHAAIHDALECGDRLVIDPLVRAAVKVRPFRAEDTSRRDD